MSKKRYTISYFKTLPLYVHFRARYRIVEMDNWAKRPALAIFNIIVYVHNAEMAC